MTRPRHDRSRELWGECRRKNRYQTIEAVERHRLERQAATGIAFTFYACRFCGGWHITKSREGALS